MFVSGIYQCLQTGVSLARVDGKQQATSGLGIKQELQLRFGESVCAGFHAARYQAVVLVQGAEDATVQALQCSRKCWNPVQFQLRT